MPYRDKSTIGTNLKRLRINSGLKQSEIADRVGISRPHLSSLENGRTSPEEKTLLDILVRGFDIPYSKAKDTMAKWHIEEALDNASDPSQVINDIVGDNNIVINGSGNTVGK